MNDKGTDMDRSKTPGGPPWSRSFCHRHGYSPAPICAGRHFPVAGTSATSKPVKKLILVMPTRPGGIHGGGHHTG